MFVYNVHNLANKAYLFLHCVPSPLAVATVGKSQLSFYLEVYGVLLTNSLFGGVRSLWQLFELSQFAQNKK